MDLGPTRAQTWGGLWGLGFIDGLPVSGSISSPFGPREPFMTPTGPTSDFHTGIDIPAPAGTPVLAPAPCVVIHQYTDNTGPYGNMVHVRFDDGTGAAFLHLRANTPMVGAGMRLRRGDVVGLVGTTGLSTGDHLHFSVLSSVPESMPQGTPAWWPRELFVDPMTYFTEQPMDAPISVYTGTVPRGGSAYVVLHRSATPQDIDRQAAYLGVNLTVIGILENGVWRMYIPDAPAQVNAGFPGVLDGGTPVFLRAA